MVKTRYNFLAQPTPHLLAHRGGDKLGRQCQNTLEAFQEAINLGYKYIETDVVLSKDGQVVVYHGSKSRRQQRKTKQIRHGLVQRMTHEEINKTCNHGYIPKLSEILKKFPNIYFNIDAKTDEVIAPLAKVIKQTNSIDRVCIASFSYKRTLGVADLLGGQDKVCTSIGPLGFWHYSLHARTRGMVLGDRIKRWRVGCIQVPYRYTSKSLIKTAHQNNVLVHVWTVNNQKQMKKLLKLGVDGIVSDKIELLKKTVDTFGR